MQELHVPVARTLEQPGQRPTREERQMLPGRHERPATPRQARPPAAEVGRGDGDGPRRHHRLTQATQDVQRLDQMLEHVEQRDQVLAGRTQQRLRDGPRLHHQAAAFRSPASDLEVGFEPRHPVAATCRNAQQHPACASDVEQARAAPAASHTLERSQPSPHLASEHGLVGGVVEVAARGPSEVGEPVERQDLLFRGPGIDAHETAVRTLHQHGVTRLQAGQRLARRTAAGTAHVHVPTTTRSAHGDRDDGGRARAFKP